MTGMGVNYSAKHCFEELSDVMESMECLYESILSDGNTCKTIDEEIRFTQPSGDDVAIDMKVLMVIYYDIVKCFHNMGHDIDFKNSDSFILPMTLNLRLGERFMELSAFESFMARDSVARLYKGLLESFEERIKNEGPALLFVKSMNNRSYDICEEYVDFMIEASDYIKIARPLNTETEDRWRSSLLAWRKDSRR